MNFAKLGYAIALFLGVGLILTFLIGPLLLTLGVEPVSVVGKFLVSFGWFIGAIAGAIFYFRGGVAAG